MKRAIVVLILAVLSIGCGRPPGSVATNAPTPVPTAEALPTGPLEQAEIAFIGHPSRAEIKTAMDDAFELYGLEATDENYSRAGSTLVALRLDAQDRGCDACTEMAILNAMTVPAAGDLGMTFPEGAAWAMAFIEAEQ